jgi:signal transduction histidine kinase
LLSSSFYKKAYLGGSPGFSSASGEKRAILTAQLALLCLFLSLFFVVSDIITGYTESFEIYALLTAVGLAAFVLNRNALHTLGKVVLMLGVNLVVFITFEREGLETGAFTFFIPCILSAFAIFSYERRNVAIALAVLSIALFIVAINVDFTWIDYADFSLEEQHMYLTLNFVIAVLTSTLVIIFLLKLNAKSEANLLKTSEELIANKLRFDLAIKGSSVGIWDWNIEGQDLFISPLLVDMLKYSQERYQNISPDAFNEVIHAEDRLNFNTNLKQHLEKGEPFHHECRIKKGDDTYMWTLVSGQAQWNKQGKAVRIIGTVVSIDELKTAFSKLEDQNVQLEKANSELDRFVYSTSHDLRAPLTSILGLSNLASTTEDTNEIRKYVEMIEDRTHAMKDFIAEIIDYSRNSRLEVAKENINLHELVEQIIEGLQYFEKSGEIDFRVDIPESLMITTDRGRLKIILNNLITNAVKYHNFYQEKPYILVKTKLENKKVIIKVEDNGLGIPSEYRDYIFAMFYRATEQSEGSGLGLYILS